MKKFILDTQNCVTNFEKDAHRLFSKYEKSRSRIISLEESKRQLSNLSIDQENLLKDAIFCVESGIFRPAIVMAWAAFIDFYEQKISSDGLIKVYAARNAWSKFKTIEELRENIVEHQLIEVGKDLGILTKHEVSVLKGDLTKRNNCAHPNEFIPNMNETIGYLSEMMSYIERLDKRKI